MIAPYAKHCLKVPSYWSELHTPNHVQDVHCQTQCSRYRLIYRTISKRITHTHTYTCTVLTMDCGAPHKWQHQISDNRLSNFPILPQQGITPQHNTQLQTSRPDITLLHTTPKGEPTITLIQLIFCRDIDYQPRLNKATTQHKH
jgi:hypothetical protein